MYKKVSESIDSLGIRFQSVAKLYYFDELKIKEIAEVLDIPEGTVKTRLIKIKERLKEQLEYHGITPTKFLSVGFTPFMFEFFQTIAQQNTMPEIDATVMLQQLHKEILAGASIAGIGVSKGVKAIWKKVSLSLGGAAIVTIGFFAFTSSHKLINEVVYPKELTSKNIQVEVLLQEKVNKKDIHIVSKEEEIPFDINKEVVSFVAQKNGDYHIQVKEETKDITIDSMDHMVPTVKEVDMHNDKVKLTLLDDKAGIDYTASYALYNNQRLKIEDNTIYGVFDHDIQVVIYDKVGNYSEYTVKIGEKSL